METIDIEAYLNSKTPFDLDRLRSRYKVTGNNNLSVIFPAFEVIAYDNNLFNLLSNSEKVIFKPEWDMRPDYVSYEYYGTVVYWSLILFLNRISTIEDFTNLDEIYVPSYDAVMIITKDKVSNRDLYDFEEDMAADTTDGQLKYYKRKVFDDIEMVQRKANNNLSKVTTTIPSISLTEMEETFPSTGTLTTTILNRAYVDLTYKPVNPSSISFYIDNFSIPQMFGYDYVLKSTPQGILKRISWAVEDCPYGDGLENLLTVNNNITIRYTYETVTT